ncbi:hypothetical protein [Colwellia echini]|uniref:Uncharacterized protein n=1 Tax=Colwellia echini TaxID=1982103 RepID=A0ABY3MYB9_9GAMM|nr:hypothetical protein [Colwellia echini]TYK66179.1 hypothetical protein CWS31_006110 [Colwellia echini]
MNSININNVDTNELQKQQVITVMQNQFAVSVNNVQLNHITKSSNTDATISAFIDDTAIDIFISTDRFGLIKEQGAAAKLTDDLYLGWNYH